MPLPLGKLFTPKIKRGIKLKKILSLCKNWSFYLFLISVPWQKRHIFGYIPLKNNFNEWTTVSIFLSDIFLLICLVFWVLETILLHKHLPKKRRSFFQAKYFILSLLFLWTLFSILHAESTLLFGFQAIKFLLAILLYLFISQNFKVEPHGQSPGHLRFLRAEPAEAKECTHSSTLRSRGLLRKRANKNRKIVYIVLLLAGVLQGGIALGQFFEQGSLGLKILGEPKIGPEIIGVAKIVVAGKKVIRPYGTFSHPNVLSGFLILCLMIAILCFDNLDKIFSINRRRFLKIILLAVVAFFEFCLVLSFTRTAWFAGAIIICIYFIKIIFTRKIKSRLPLLLVLLGVILISLLIYPEEIFSRATLGDSGNGDLALSNRLFLNGLAFRAITQYPFLGIGKGNFVLSIAKLTPKNLEAWRFQPVHNIYLAYAAETGIPSLLLWLAFLWLTFKGKAPPQQKNDHQIFKLILGAFCLIGFFDHYLYDLQQGVLILWIVLGLIPQPNIETKLKNDFRKNS